LKQVIKKTVLLDLLFAVSGFSQPLNKMNIVIILIDDASALPFFLYMACYTVPTPIEALPQEVAYYEKKVRPEQKHTSATSAAMIKRMDENVGRILESLDSRGIAGRTIVIFTSDNGGFSIPWRHFPHYYPTTTPVSSVRCADWKLLEYYEDKLIYCLR